MLSYKEDLDIETKVSKYIGLYFKDKNFSKKVNIFSKKYIDLCLTEDICSAVDKAYFMMKKSGRFQEKISPIGEDVRFVIKLLNRIRRIVPKEICAGVFLMHLDLIENIN